MKLTPVIDGKHKSLRGAVGALLAVGASPEGLWLIENIPWTTTCRLLRSRDGVRFEVSPLPPSIVSWSDASEAYASVLAVGDSAWVCGRGGLLHASGDTLTPVTGIKPADKSGHARLWDVAQGPSGELWLASERRLVHSADGGKTWKSLPIKMPRGARVLWAVLPLAERVLTAGDGGIYALVGKRSQQVFSRPDAVVRKLAASPTGTVVAVGDGGLVVSSKDGTRWTALAGASGDLSCVAWCGDRFVIGGEAGALYTTDGTRKPERVKGPDEETHLTGLAPFRDGFFVAARRGFGSAVLLWSGGTLKAAPATRAPTPPPTRVPAPRPRDKVKTRPLPPAQPLAWKDAVKRFPALERSVVDADELEGITLYRGAVAAASFPDHADVSKRVVIVDGDLSLEGALAVWAAQDDDTELVLVVNGTLSARSVSVGNDARLLVTKDLVVEDVVVCGDGSWGRIEVGGAVHTRALLVSGHTSVSVKGAINGLVVAPAGKVVGTSTPQPVPAADVLRSALCTDDHFDVRGVRKALKEGRVVLR